MSRIMSSLAVLAMMGTAAQAQEPPSARKPAAAPTASAGAPQPAGADQPAGDQTYQMKDGGTYQPPAQRPASPAQDLKVYGRT